MSTYRNNLKKGDPVIAKDTRRPGEIAADVRHNSRTVMVKFQGVPTPQRVDVLQLRLVVDGKPEDCPPIDGQPPERLQKPARSTAESTGGDAVNVLKASRDQLNQELEEMSARFKALRERRDKISQAIDILEPPKAAAPRP